jgi:hypothetical protein
MNDVNQIAKDQIRFWLAQIDGFKVKYRAGELTKEEWLTKTREYKIRIEAVQTVFRKA